MPATNFQVKTEQQTTFEGGYPTNTEHFTYYPTWYNGVPTTGQTTTTTTTTGMMTTSQIGNIPVSRSTGFSTLEDISTVNKTTFVRTPFEDIVITGVSGRFPESENVEEFAQNLFNGVDMVTEEERRWPTGLFGLPKRNGTIKDITRFDSQFFGINPKQVENMDPQQRLLLEVTYEAIFDSGINPFDLKGTRTGVFIGASSAEAMQAYSVDTEKLSGYSMTGGALNMLANRLSFFYDFKGPSYVVDTACSSSLVALDAAINAIKTGQCDYAVVGGVNLLSRPQTSLQFQRLGMLSPEGKCQSFDAQGKGYVRSETVAVIFLQRKSTCRRFYAKVLHSKINADGAKEQGITFPNGEMQSRLLKEIYSEANIDPSLVTYVEAHGTGTRVGDPQELNAIAEVFTSHRAQRTVPLFIGSTKSNMGHPESASGIAALIKMLISIQRGIIPANLHYQEPHPEVNALLDGRLKVVNENTKFRGGLMALNSFGFGGVNAHILLQPNNEFIMTRMGSSSFWNQDLSEISRQPRLFQFCSRTQEGLEQVMEHMHRNSTDLATHFLLHPNSTSMPSTHPYRGFTILNGQQRIQEIQQVPFTMADKKRPIWYVFSGMGTQWQNMGQDLMKIETFRQSILKSNDILKPYGINLIELIYAKQQNVYERTVNAFVGIAAIQIALVDCLRQVGIEADGMIGHSVGELGCAYADGCFTQEETLLSAYYRGKCIEEAQLPHGAMAAVGLTWEQCQQRCPSGVVPACHNSVDTVTVSGPKMAVLQFVEQLKSEGIFAKEVDSSNVAFHSHYMTSIAPSLRSALQTIIRMPKQRSSRWISTSVPEQRWETELARFSSPDYHVNNLCSPVLFQEALTYVPTNAITIEIAPHALLQAILRRSLSPQTVQIALMKKDVVNHLEHFYSQFGRLYNEGINVNSMKLFLPQGSEQTIYPVPVNTGFLSHLVRWDHEQQWTVPNYEDFLCRNNFTNGTEMPTTFVYPIDLSNTVEDAYLTGHQIDNRVIFPATGYLHLIWKSLAKMHGIHQIEQMPIVFENIEIHRPTIMGVKEQQTIQHKKVTFTVNVLPTKGLFEITEGGSVVVTGRAYMPEQPIDIQMLESLKGSFTGCQRTDMMEQEEIYKELRLRGYDYQGEFQPIIKADIEGTRGELMWTGKWIPFIDAMLQMNVLGQKRGLLLPTRIRSIKIDPRIHLQTQNYVKIDEFGQRHIYKKFEQYYPHQQTVFSVPVVFDPYTNTTVSGGIEIVGLHAQIAPRRHLWQPTVVERVNFVPYIEKHFDDEYTEQLDDNENVIINYPTMEPTIRQQREYINHYLNECKRYTNHILRKIENPTCYMQPINPTPFAKHMHHHFEQMNLNGQTGCESWTTTNTTGITGITTTTMTPKTPYEEMTEGGKLLHLLMHVANIESVDGQYFYKVQKIFNDNFAYWKALEEDKVLNYVNKRSYYLKSFLDTVLENMQYVDYKQQPKLKVLEISPSFGQFFGIKMNNFLKTYPTQYGFVDYHYVPTMCGTEYMNVQPDEYWTEVNKGMQFPIQKVEWNFGLRNGQLIAEPPKHLKDFDLVIFNGSLSTLLPYVDSEFGIKRWLQTIAEKVMKPQGFMFVHEYTNNFDILNNLNRLEQIVFRQQSIHQQAQVGSFLYPIQKYQTEQQWRQLIEECGFYPVALKSDSLLSTMFLYRRPVNFTCGLPTTQTIMGTPCEEKIFIDDMDQYGWIEKVKIALGDNKLERIWLISERTPNSGIVGLVNCLRKEIGGHRIRCVFIADKQPLVNGGYIVPIMHEQLNNTTKFIQWNQLFDQIRRADLVMNVFRNGKWGSFRHVFDGSSIENILIDTERQLYEQQQQTCRKMSQHMENACINMLQRGDLSTLKWMQTPEPCVTVADKQVICQVDYAALNFRDIMLATGKLTPEAIPGYYKMHDGMLGMEFSGYAKNNRHMRYMGMMPAKGLATTVVVDPRYLWEVPTEWTLEQAATVPVAYSTAYYALIVRGALKRGETVLVHAGSGAVGQAAIAVALSHGCRVFVTVSTEEKKEFLKSLFPGQLTDDSFATSRDILFEKHIMNMTQGRGVDVVLNSLAEDKLQASVRVLSQHGRFLEIGKFDLNNNSQLGMSVFLKNISFHGILVDSLFEEENKEWKRVHQLVQEGIHAGVVRPIVSTIFEKHQIEEAFRYMAQGKHIGKVLIKIGEQFGTTTVNCEQPITTHVTGLPRVWFSPLQTYIITGGLGGFGLELAQWMVERGARRLIITSRQGVRNGYQTRKLRTMQEEFGAQIQVCLYDVKEEDECILLVKEAVQMSPEQKIGGIFHLAAVLEDGLFENQTEERFKRATDVKFLGAYNLDKCTRMNEIMEPNAYFVVFSSVTSGRGNFGQTNYGFANSAMERICEFRRRDGKHALAIQWGAIADVGLIVESTLNYDNETMIAGTMPQRIFSCLKTLELLLLKSTEPKDTAIWSSFVPAERRFSSFEMQPTMTPVNKSLLEIICNIIGLKDYTRVIRNNEQITLGEMGLDSLMSTEIKQVLETMYNFPMSTKEIHQLTFEKLRTIEQTKTFPVSPFVETTFSGIPITKTTTTTFANKKTFLMPTRAVERLNQIEFIPSTHQIPVVVIHPIEGHVNMLKGWAKHMKYPVFGVQYTPEAMQFQTIEQLADFYWQQIENELYKQTLTQTTFTPRVHLCGYSFGASVAYEMASKKYGRVASLTLLDGSHSYVNAHVNTYKSKFQLENMPETESEALYTFAQQYIPVLSRKEFIENMIQFPTYEQRIKHVVRELINKSQFQFEPVDLEQAARSYVNKIFMSQVYQPKQMPRLGEMLLIKSGQKNKIVQNVLGEDYGLGQVFNGKVQIQVVDGDHKSFLETNGYQVAGILNEYLVRFY